MLPLFSYFNRANTIGIHKYDFMPYIVCITYMTICVSGKTQLEEYCISIWYVPIYPQKFHYFSFKSEILIF